MIILKLRKAKATVKIVIKKQTIVKLVRLQPMLVNKINKIIHVNQITLLLNLKNVEFKSLRILLKQPKLV